MARIQIPIDIANRILENFLGERNLLRDYGNGVWKFRSSEYTQQTKDDREGAYLIHPFPIREELYNENYPFYLAFSMFLYGDGSIKTVNLKVFRENVLGKLQEGFISTELLLRAEWSNEESADDAKFTHAQPHWHIHPYQIIDKISSKPLEFQKTILALMDEEDMEQPVSIFSELEDTPQSEVPKLEKREVPMFRFHLAMVADWHNNARDTNNKKIDNEVLKIWLPQCLNYIKEQLEYILEKLG